MNFGQRGESPCGESFDLFVEDTDLFIPLT